MKMKQLFLLFIGIIFSVCVNAQAVEVLLEKTELKKGEHLHFTVKASPEIQLEIAVFSDDKVVLHQNSRLSDKEELFDIDMKEFPAGSYHVLVSGDDVHIQKDFVVKD